MAWKTRKNRKQTGSGWLNYFRKKNVITTNNTVPLVTNNSVAYTRKGSIGNFVDMKKRKAFAAKSIRNHLKRLKNTSNEVRSNALKLMNNTTRSKIQPMLNYKNLNSLSNDQIVEFYITGKARSASY